MKQITSMKEFQDYLGADFERIEHHAGRVRSTVLILSGLVACKAEPGSVNVRTYAGTTKNVIWFKAGGSDYCLSYNHEQECIDVRFNSLQGDLAMQVNDDDLSWIGALSDIFSGENADAQAA